MLGCAFLQVSLQGAIFKVRSAQGKLYEDRLVAQGGVSAGRLVGVAAGMPIGSAGVVPLIKGGWDCNGFLEALEVSSQRP
jgi:hypothetical protein